MESASEFDKLTWCIQKKGVSEMKRTIVSVLTFCILMFTAESFAQPMMKWRGSGGWGPGSKYGRMYDPKTVDNITGQVEKIEKVTYGRGMSYGIHLLVKTEKETADVLLGPGWYIENQDVKILPGDKVDIKGSRVTLRGNRAIIAAEIKKGDEVLQLRDENGFPAWAGWRRR